MRELTSSSGVEREVLPAIAVSINCDCTSIFTNCCSNWSMVIDIFSRLLVASAESNALTMELIDLFITIIFDCVSNRDTTASRRDDNRR
ncbi:hypothetical protein Mapa_002960 [Marchantia paleacea]|nr:hypothetical protein Mapa_002960 [Marchantia paleacea]